MINKPVIPEDLIGQAELHVHNMVLVLKPDHREKHAGTTDALAGAESLHIKNIKLDALVKSRKTLFFVIPVKTGIQYFKIVTCTLDSRLRGNDDF